jgi:hypothetical protein
VVRPGVQRLYHRGHRGSLEFTEEIGDTLKLSFH